MKVFSIFLGIIIGYGVYAQTNMQVFGGLPLGNMHIGFKITTIYDDTRLTGPDKNILGEKVTTDRTRKITLHIWYPAELDARASAMSLGDYALSYQQEEVNQPIDTAARTRRFNTLRDQLKNFFGSVNEKDLEKCLEAQLLARKNASPAKGKFPVLVGMLRSFSTTLTNEFLASHGYIVVMVKPSAFPASVMSLRYIDEVQDLRRATLYAMHSLNADPDAIGSFGFSGAGFTQVLFSMNDYRPKALADLESGLYMEGLWQSWSTCDYYNVNNLRIPFLHIFSRDLSKKEKYISEFKNTRFSRRYYLMLNQPALHHWDFATEGMISCTILKMRGPQQQNIQSSSELANIYLLNFFNQELKNDKTAFNFLERRPKLKNYHDSLWSMSILPAMKPAPTADEFVSLVTEKGVEEAIRILESRLPEDSSTNLLDGSILNRIGYNYLAGQQKKEAIAVFKLNVKFHPQEPNWQDSLLEGLVADGRKAEARTVYQALNENIEKSSLPADRKEDMKKRANTLIEKL